jgi:hypothetical protein
MDGGRATSEAAGRIEAEFPAQPFESVSRVAGERIFPSAVRSSQRTSIATASPRVESGVSIAAAARPALWVSFSARGD